MRRRHGMSMGAVRALGRPLRRSVRGIDHWLAERRDPMRSWLVQARNSTVEGSSVWDQVWTNRHRMVAELASGGSFLDLGGM